MRYFALLTIGLCVTLMMGCHPNATPCQSDLSCPKGFVCAQTNVQSLKVCVILPKPKAAPFRPTPATRRSVILAKAKSPIKPCLVPPLSLDSIQSNGGKRVKLDKLDQELFVMLRRVYYTSQNCHQQIWGGRYQMHKIPTYLVNVGDREPGGQRGIRGFLINHPNPPPTAALVDSKQTLGIQGVYLYQGHKNAIGQSGFDFSLPIHSVKVYAMAYGTQDANRPTKKEFLRLFVHEGFHRAQEFEEAWQTARGHQNIEQYSFNPEDIALILLEHRVLASAYQNGGRDSALEALITLFAIRTLRMHQDKSGQQLIENYDNFQEHLEGTAMYTESAFSAAVGVPYTADESNGILDRLWNLEKLAPQGDSTFVRETVTSRAYGTGAAIGVLLDRIGDQTWKDSIRAGRTFYQHLHSMYAAIPIAQQDQRIIRAKQKQDFPKLLTLAQSLAHKIASKATD